MGWFGAGVGPHHRKTSPYVSSEAAPVGYFRSLLGQITVDGQTLSALNAKKVLLNFYKDDSTGWTFFNSGLQGDGTSTLVITNRPLKNPPSTLASASTI